MTEVEKSLAVRNVWQADLENGMFQNPILHADYSWCTFIKLCGF